PARSPVYCSTPPMASAVGRRSASARTSSKPAGRPSPTPSSTASSTRRTSVVGMTQPEYVPIVPGDRVRGAERLPVPNRWTADGSERVGPRLGHGGPDQGFALKLAKRFEDRLEVTTAEHKEDAIAGAVPVAMRRAALMGRAPVIYDLEHAFTLWGFLGDAPA